MDLTYEQLEQKQELKRKHLEKAVKEDIIFDYYSDRQSFQKKKNPYKHVILLTSDLINLNHLKQIS